MGASTSVNSTLTQAQVEKILIQPLLQASTYLRQGFPTFSSPGNPIKVPSLTSVTSATFTAQGSAIPEATVSTTEVVFLSSTVLAYKTIVRVSNELLAQGVTNVEAAFTQAMLQDVTRNIDASLWNGPGTAGAPLGLCKMTGYTNSGTVAGTALTSDVLFDMQKDYELAFGDTSAALWAMSPVNANRVRKLTDSYGGRVLQPSLALGAPPTLLGAPYVVSTAIPDTGIWLVDRNQSVGVGLDTTASVTVLDQTFAAYDEVGLRVVVRADTQTLHAASIVKKTIS